MKSETMRKPLPIDLLTVFGRRGVEPFAEPLPRLGREFIGFGPTTLGGEVG